MKKLYPIALLLVFMSVHSFGARFYATENNLWSNPNNWDSYPGTNDSVNLKASCLLEATDNVTIDSIHAPYNDPITFDILGDLTVTTSNSTAFTIIGATSLSSAVTATVNVEGSVNLTGADPSYTYIAYPADANAFLNINGGSFVTASRLQIGEYGHGTVTVSDSGTLGALHCGLGSRSVGSGKLILNSGTVSAAGNLTVGVRGQGVLEMYGGSLNVDNIFYVGNSGLGGTGTAYLKDGTVSAGGLNFQDGSVDVEAAVITVNRDESAAVDNYVASGILTGYGKAENIEYTFDGSITTIWAVPDPNTCINPPVYDTNDDCKIDIIDFTNLTSEWLDCGFSDPGECW